MILQMGQHGGGMSAAAGGGMLGLGFLWPLLWLLVIAAVVLGVVSLFGQRGDVGTSDRATTLLREQYARGEIDDEEFDDRSFRLRWD